MDFRFVAGLQDFLRKEGMEHSFDLVSLAGAAKTFVSPQNEAERALLLRQIEISQRLHAIQEVWLINHRDCGAYGGAMAFASPEDELTTHTDDLNASRSLIQKQFPALRVRLFLAALHEDQSVDMTIIS